jgi:site-specific recombinase XerD
MNVKTALADFLEAASADGLRLSTLDWYKYLLSPFADAHNLSLESVETKNIRQYINGLREKYGSEDTISGHIRALHKFWSWCADEYSIPNPMRSIRYPKKPEAKPKAISLDDVDKLFTATGNDLVGVRNRALLSLLIDTGCRAGGLLQMRPEDVELSDLRALVNEKGNKTRKIVFTEYTAAAIQRWIAIRLPAPTLFYNFETLKPLTHSGLRGILKRLARRAGVTGKVNPHSFRHAFAREYLRANGDLATLSKLMGHADESTTLHHYANFTSDEAAEAHRKYSPMNRLKAAKNE